MGADRRPPAQARVVEERHGGLGEAEVAVDRAEEAEDPALARLDGEHDVLERGKLGGDLGNLEGPGEADPGTVGGVEVVDPLALEGDGAGVLGDFADDLLDERRLARPVRTDQGVDLAGADIEGDAARCLEGAEGFLKAGDLQDGVRHSRSSR